jgi:hypothetical protein
MSRRALFHACGHRIAVDPANEFEPGGNAARERDLPRQAMKLTAMVANRK